MNSVRQIKKKFFRRQWFSSKQILKLDDGRIEIWPMKRHGLAYNDSRSTGTRWPKHGMRALLEVPYDDLHRDRKIWKKKSKVSEKAVNTSVRILRAKKNPFMKHMSFKTAQRFFYKHKISTLDAVTLIDLCNALNKKYLEKKREQ